MDVVRRGNEVNVNGENDSVDGYGVVGWSKGRCYISVPR